MYLLTIFRISGGMVAENSHVTRSSKVCERILSISSLKPMLSISSASSNTTYLTLPSLMAFLLIKSSKRPGVATTICVGLLSAFI